MKNRFFLCFRPVVPETDFESNHVGASPYISVANAKDLKITGVKSRFSDDKESRASSQPIDDRRKSSSRSSFARSLGAVLFVITLKRRVRHRKVGGLNNDSKGSPLRSSSDMKNGASSKRCLSRSKWLEQESHRIANPRGRREVKTENRVTSRSNSDSGLFLILITLCITMLWGRVCAILFTLIAFYFLPRQSDFEGSPESKAESVPERQSSRDHKRKVVMEGLLKRSSLDSIKHI